MWIPPSIYNNNNNNNSAAFKCDYSRFVSTCMPPVLWLGWLVVSPLRAIVSHSTDDAEERIWLLFFVIGVCLAYNIVVDLSFVPPTHIATLRPHMRRK